MGAMATGGRDMANGRWREGMQHMEESAVVAELDDDPGPAMEQRLWSQVVLTAVVAGDTAQASEALSRLLRVFDTVDGSNQPWDLRVEAELAVGQVEAARASYQRWAEEVPEAVRPEDYPQQRRRSQAALLIGEGDFASAAREYQGIRRERRCSTCGRLQLAQAYVGLGREPEAIELLLDEQASFSDPAVFPLLRMVATMRLGPLFEATGDADAALEQYRTVVDTWGDGDPELQGVVRHARERIAALGG